MGVLGYSVGVFVCECVTVSVCVCVSVTVCVDLSATVRLVYVSCPVCLHVCLCEACPKLT